jgi:hypothetical protein
MNGGEIDPEVCMRSLAGNLRLCFVIAAGIGLMVAEGGCWKGSRPMRSGHRSTGGSFTFLNSASERSHAHYDFCTWREGLVFLKVDDLSKPGESSFDFYHAVGSASNKDGTRYEWRLDTSDGITATVRINDKDYDIAEGTLFVVTAQRDKVEVHQLSRDLSELARPHPFDHSAIIKFLGNDSEVRKILGIKDEDK